MLNGKAENEAQPFILGRHAQFYVTVDLKEIHVSHSKFFSRNFAIRTVSTERYIHQYIIAFYAHKKYRQNKYRKTLLYKGINEYHICVSLGMSPM